MKKFILAVAMVAIATVATAADRTAQLSYVAVKQGEVTVFHLADFNCTTTNSKVPDLNVELCKAIAIDLNNNRSEGSIGAYICTSGGKKI